MSDDTSSNTSEPIKEKKEPDDFKSSKGIIKLPFSVAQVLANLLPRITVKSGSKNVHKSRVQRYFAEQLKEFEEERMKLVDQYAEKDEAGKNILKDNNYVFKDIMAFTEAFVKLQKELPIIIDATSDTVKKNALEVVRDALVSDDNTAELSPQESIMYLLFVENFETAFPYPEKKP